MSWIKVFYQEVANDSLMKGLTWIINVIIMLTKKARE